jgi:hypothetical protein
MEKPAMAPEMDALLLPFAKARDEAEADRHLEQVISLHARPLIQTILRGRLGSARGGHGHREAADREDISSRVVLQIVGRLRGLKGDPGSGAIGDFRGYVAAATYRSCNQYLRERYPQRHRMRRRLRYLLTHDPALAVWETPQSDLCGLASWRDATALAAPLPAGAADRALREALADPRREHVPSGRLVAHLLAAVGRPVAFETLVTAVAEVWAAEEERPRAERRAWGTDSASHGAPPTPPAVSPAEDRIYLRELWQRIQELPRRQRAALLLNLRDGEGHDLIGLLPLTGVASIRQIAGALEMPPEHLAQIWNELPLDDRAIASHLGLTRQQVVNLRSAARQRLARQMNP